MAAAAASCRTVLGFRTVCACCSRKTGLGVNRFYWRRLTAAPRAFDRCKKTGLPPALFFGRKVGGLLVEPLYIITRVFFPLSDFWSLLLDLRAPAGGGLLAKCTVGVLSSTIQEL